MLIVMKGMLLFGHVHAGEPLMILSTIHHVLLLLLETILPINSEVVNHGGARR